MISLTVEHSAAVILLDPGALASREVALKIEHEIIKPRAKGSVEVMLSLLDAIGVARGDYFSVPFSTGRRRLEYESADSATKHNGIYKQVISPNINDAAILQCSLQLDHGIKVINPARLGSVKDWEQRDYHAFWIQVIKSYATRLILHPEWYLSAGCVLEAFAATEFDLPISVLETFDNGNRAGSLVPRTRRGIVDSVLHGRHLVELYGGDSHAHNLVLKGIIKRCPQYGHLVTK